MVNETQSRQAADASSIVRSLREHTPARVALSRTGVSITARHALDFSLAHAQARDAVHSALAVPSLLSALRSRSLAPIAVKSAAPNRAEYLRRPDLGRTLAAGTTSFLESLPKHTIPATTLSLILADGLSALATERHALGVLDALLPLLDPTWRLAPIVVAEQARVALADPIGLALHADATVILLGERPGLSSPDSLGAYIIWQPRPGRTDAERNCISNIRPPLAGQHPAQAGLDYPTAAARIARTLNQARRLGLTGVTLRADDPEPSRPLDPSLADR